MLSCLSLGTLSGCDFFKKDKGEDKEEVETVIDIKTIKDGLTVLNTKTNYTLTSSFKGNDQFITQAPIKFTKNFIGRDNEDRANTDLKIKDNTGIYRLSYDGGFVSGEYLKDKNGHNYTSLYDNSIVSTMYGVCTDYVNSISASETSLVISNKSYKLAFIKTVGFQETDYSKVNSLSVTFLYDGHVTFYLNMNDSSRYTYQIVDHGTTKSTNYETFINNNGKAYTPSTELAEFRTLLRSNNFMQNLFYFDLEQENYGFYYLRYCFAPHYFYSYTITDPSSMSGYIEAESTEYQIKGIYGFSVVNNKIDSVNTANAYSSKPDIVAFQHYPSLLKILDDLQYIHQGSLDGAREDFEGSTKYYFTNEYYIKDFEKNFSLDQSSFVEFENAGVEIEINLNYANPSNDNIVEPVMCFHYLFKYGTMTFDYPFPIFGFGKATMNAFDVLYDTLND